MKTTSTIQFSEGFKRAFHSTYQAIGSDVEAAFEEHRAMPHKDWLAIMAESVIDANRMQMYGGADGKEADAELHRLCKEHDYEAVLRAAEKLLTRGG